MKAIFVNPPFKAEYGKFVRENRSAAITRSGTLYYPLWLIYAAAVCEKDGIDVELLDAAELERAVELLRARGIKAEVAA